MNYDDYKRAAALAALNWVEDDSIVGVGTGSTVNFFIDALASIKGRIEAAVSSSEASTERLRSHGIPVMDLNAAGTIPVYVDGADEIDSQFCMIKGGGGALTREKIVAAASERFVCIADYSKRVDVLGTFPIPVEVIPMGRSYVGRELLKLGGQPVLREDFVTDNGNLILDWHNVQLLAPRKTEAELNGIAGVVTAGIFAARGADVMILGGPDGVETQERSR